MSDFYKKIAENEQKIKEKVEFALDYAKKAGASDCEINIASRKGMNVSSRNCELENVEYEYDRAMTVTIYCGHKQAHASTTDLSENAIISTVNAAKDLTQFTSEDPCNGVLDKEYLCKEIKDYDVLFPILDDAETASKKCIELEECALNKKANGIVKSDGASFYSGVYTNAYGASNGFIGVNSFSNNSLNLSLIGKYQDKMQTEGGFSSDCNLNKLYPIERIAQEAIDNTIAKLDVKKIKTGAYNVIFSKTAAISLISTLYKAISGSLIYKQSSFLLDSIGKQIFPQFLQIKEDPFVKGRLDSSSYDEEGCVRQVNDLITDGVLNMYLLSSYSAKKLNLKPNGHCGSLGSIFVSAKEQCDFMSLLKSVGSGIVVTDLMGQGVDIVSGNYSRGASGYYFENGERIHAVDEITIASNLKDLFLNIKALANDYDERYKTKCPSFVIENVTVAANT